MKLSRKRLATGLVLAALLGCAEGAAAQVDAGSRSVRDVERQRRLDELQRIELENRFRANEEVPLEQRALIDYGGYTTLQYLSVDDRDNNNHGLRQADFYLYGRLNLDGANELFARGRISHYDFNRGDNFFTLQKDGWSDADLDRGYYRFDLSRYNAAYKGTQLPYNVIAQAGRDLVYWGNGLTMGMVIDGGILDLTWHDLTLELIAGVTPVRTVDIDTSRPAFDYNTRRGFYGGMFTWNPDTPNFGRHHPFLYVLTQRDYNSHDFLQQGPISTKFEYDSWYIGTGSTGSLGDHLLYGVEAAYEGGHTLSNSFRVNGFALEQVHQTQDQIQALAADFRLDYLLNDPRNTRFGIELILASGDPDRGHSTNTFNGNRPNTRDLSFNGFGLINTGLAFAPEVSNLNALQFSASSYPFATVSPFQRLQLGTDVFVYNKLRKNGGFIERTDNGHFLGVEPDAYLNWQITSDVTLAVRYGIFFPTSNVIQHEANRQFLYTGVTFAF
jgi:hypothetical protein